MQPLALVLHGGAGTLPEEQLNDTVQAQHEASLREALDIGWTLLEAGATALEAVEATTRSLEDCPLFNAGRGSVYTHDGKHEMDASIMCGETKRAGAIASVRQVRNPISLARKVLDDPSYVFLVGQGAEEYARIKGLEFCAEDYFDTEFRWQQLQEARSKGSLNLDHTKYGTVGAAALDRSGNLAAATSTGGLTNKQYGRVGDSALIGAGTLADNATCAISCTGYGEAFIQHTVAHEVSARMHHAGQSLVEAANYVIHHILPQPSGEGGLIAVDSLGNVCLPFNTQMMYRGWRTSALPGTVAIRR